MVRQYNVRVCEVRFCPELHTVAGLSARAATEAVIAGFQRAQALVAQEGGLGLRGGVIVCALRSLPSPHAVEMVGLAAKFLGQGVVGFDVAGDEGAYPLHLFSDAIELAATFQVPVTVHAGEWPNTLDNLRLAITGLSGIQRLGHAYVASDSTITSTVDFTLMVSNWSSTIVFVSLMFIIFILLALSLFPFLSFSFSNLIVCIIYILPSFLFRCFCRHTLFFPLFLSFSPFLLPSRFILPSLSFFLLLLFLFSML